MREFIYFSRTAPTTGNFGNDLMKAGRMDIVCHSVINTFFVSHNVRDDTKLHLVFYGGPDPPRHLELSPGEGVDLSKKDIAGLIKRMLYKHKSGKKTEVYPGYFIEKKNLFQVIEDLGKESKQLYILDKKGKFLRDKKISKNPVFLVGDHDGLPKKEMKRLKALGELISLGNNTYFASQTITILQHELDIQK